MAAISTILAGAGLALGAAGAYANAKAGQQQAAEMRKASAFQQKQANLQNARQKRDAVREARIAYGTAQNTAANQGVSGSSGSAGGLSSIAAQASDNISFLDQYGFFSDQASKAIGRANEAQANAATGAAISGLGFSIVNNATTLTPKPRAA